MTKLDTGTEDLRAEIDDGVAVITMNRPDRRNAFSPDMISALGAVLARVETDEAVGCVVLTGAAGAFSAGGDVKSMADRGDDGSARSVDAAIHRQRLNQRATSGRLWSMPKPTIAAIGGPAAGAGLSLALACDLRYAVPGAVLTTAFARVAFAGDYGGTWFLTRLVGSGKAKELYYFSERLTAEDAERLGIVNAIFPADGLRGGGHGAGSPAGPGAVDRLPLHEGEPEPGGGRRAGRVPGPRSDPPCAHRAHRGPP